MSCLLAVDPGIRGSGIAVFNHGTLVHASYVRSTRAHGDGPAEVLAMAQAIMTRCTNHFLAVTEIVVEWPQVYRAGKLKGDPNDLLPLAAVAGALAAIKSGAISSRYRPNEWKGQLPKDVANARVLARLTAFEHPTIESTPKPHLHNVIDAIGIGLHHLGRGLMR